MKLKSISLVLATTALAALSLPSFAQDQDKSGSNLTTTSGGEKGAVATLSMAYELYGIGIASGDALTVLTAARLAASAEVEAQEPAALDPAGFDAEGLNLETFAKKRAPSPTPAAPAPVMKDEPRPAAVATFRDALNEDEGEAETPATAAAMFAKATELAGDNEALKEIIADAEAETSRGRIGGGVSWLSRLNSGKVDIWQVPFYGNSYAEVAVAGDGDANLDVVITDENGNVVCYDVSPSDQVYCDFVPAWDGYFYIAVENTGRKRNSYYLLTN
ncbi:hypothetical protein [Pseudogemmobacter humi]|uniref:Peptidase C-terminal archaeal/bacterial domain-containing protein n=1 Tax=Pseudogemmobacter humi TaxID=2483812 RepID=A0A3P5WMY7_9RHOB|nr:hypothetical protein [Pseudogemmobacter humi]VDC19926.1 hypothetical protein XINFAN_00313 [Pseudogemmobacter humi]